MHSLSENITHLYPFIPKKLNIGGHNLSYLDEGEGPVIVMLHGNPTWSFYYRNLVQLLKKSYRVIAPDHMGCGFSDKPQDYPYRLKNHIDNLEQLLGHLGVADISLVMHDWGGAIGMGYAVRHSETIRSLVVMNSAAFRSSRIPLRIRICRVPVLGDLLVRGLNGFAGPATFMAVARSMDRNVKKGFLAPYDSWKNRVAVLRFVQDIPLSAKEYSWQTLVDIEDGLAKLQDKPMLLLWGGKDFCFTRHFFAEWRQRFPKSKYHYFENGGHYLLEDAFDQIGPLVQDFFAEHLQEGLRG
jgi:haloalkane dehalogenase